MTTNELMIKVKETLESNGFEIKDFSPNCSASAMKDGKCYMKEIENSGYIYNLRQGYDIYFETAYSYNGRKNVTVKISLNLCENFNVEKIAIEKVNTHMSEKQINNRIKKIIDLYEKV